MDIDGSTLVGTTAQPAANPRAAVLGSEDSLLLFSFSFCFSFFFLKDFLNQPVWKSAVAFTFSNF
jgi:hypothetical protein